MLFSKWNVKKNIRIAIHATMWIIIWLGLRYFSIPSLTKDNINAVENAAVVSFSWTVILFYFVGYFIFPKFLNKRRVFWLIPIFLLIFEVTYILNFYHFKYLFSISDATKRGADIYIGRVWLKYLSTGGLFGWMTSVSLTFLNYSWSFFYVTPILGLKAVIDVIRSRNRNHLLETEKLRLESHNLVLTTERLSLQRDLLMMEISFLHAQVNPHFLFNKLNSIYGKLIDVDEQTADTVARLAELMRYSLSVANRGFVLIEDEVSYLKAYIDLEIEKMEDGVRITYQFSIDNNQFKIAPLILITFIENAFKHVPQASDSFVTIHIKVELGVLTMVIENTDSHPLASKQNDLYTGKYHGGIGLQNVQKRLDLLYSNNYLLAQTNNGSTFITELTLSELPD